jgi:hypothetical protein
MVLSRRRRAVASVRRASPRLLRPPPWGRTPQPAIAPPYEPYQSFSLQLFGRPLPNIVRDCPKPPISCPRHTFPPHAYSILSKESLSLVPHAHNTLTHSLAHLCILRTPDGRVPSVPRTTIPTKRRSVRPPRTQFKPSSVFLPRSLSLSLVSHSHSLSLSAKQAGGPRGAPLQPLSKRS